MAQSGSSGDQRHDAEWLQQTAAAREHRRGRRGDGTTNAPLRWTEAALMHRGALDLVEPFADMEIEGITPEGRLAAQELERVRHTLGATPATFEPLRHTIMVLGRPVQVFIPTQPRTLHFQTYLHKPQPTQMLKSVFVRDRMAVNMRSQIPLTIMTWRPFRRQPMLEPNSCQIARAVGNESAGSATSAWMR